MSSKSIIRSTVQTGLGLACVYATWATLRRLEERTVNAGLAKGKRFIILGGGFAGAAVAQELARLLPGQGNGEILLIDEDNYLLFTPMLTEAAGGELETRHIVSPLRSVEPRARFVQGRITKIDLAAKSVQVETHSGNLDPATQTFQADHLIIALGSVTNFHGTPGAAENSIPMKKLDDARGVFQRVSACLERAAVEPDAAKRKELLTFVVGGGGYTGVETMAAVNDLVRASVTKLPLIQPREIRTVIVQPGDRLLPELSADLASYATEKLKERGVEVLLNTGIASATDQAVDLQNGEHIPARTLIWAAGITPNPLIADLPATKGKHHGLTVDGCCQVPGHAGVWALGDCAEIPNPATNETYAPTAQNATREGKLVAQNIVGSLRNQSPKPFRYTPLGELALVGRHSGVARVYGHNFSGLLAWAMWRGVYLAKMPDIGQRGRILCDWLLDMAFGRVPVPVSEATNASR
jgi:NADH dehydrogenase